MQASPVEGQTLQQKEKQRKKKEMGKKISKVEKRKAKMYVLKRDSSDKNG